MKNEDMFYFHKEKAATFESRKDLVAIYLRPDLSEEQDKELLMFCSQLKLEPEEIDIPEI